MFRLLILSLFMSFSLNVFSAGQCEIVSSELANKAIKILKNNLKSQVYFVIDDYCEACMDILPRPILVEQVKLQSLDQNFFRILVNDKVIDMAYTYVNGVNLAKEIGCKVVAVSKNLD